MKKVKLFFTILGALLMIVPYFINWYSIFRLISLLMGLIIFLVGILYELKSHLLLFIVPLISIVGLYIFDYVFTKSFEIVPIISIKKTSSDKIKTYDSFLYRTYDCNGMLIFDNKYQKNFMCKPSDIKIMSINTFLENPLESYKKYKGVFVHLSGKINTITGNSSLTLNAYEDAVEVNGYVDFDSDKKVKITNLNFEVDKFHVYDYVEVIGLVKSISVKDEVYEITLNDGMIVDTHIYDNFELSVNLNNDKSLVKVSDNVYYLGIIGIYYRYTDKDIYELDYLLEDKRESIDNLIKDAKKTEEEDYTLYELSKYNIIKCNDGDIIFANNTFHNLKNICIK